MVPIVTQRVIDSTRVPRSGFMKHPNSKWDFWSSGQVAFGLVLSALRLQLVSFDPLLIVGAATHVAAPRHLYCAARCCTLIGALWAVL